MENKILVDSSCWIEFFRGKRADLNDSIRELLLKRQVLICGPVYLEVLGFCVAENESRKVAALFDDLQFLDLAKSDFQSASFLSQQMRRKGITIKGMDVLFAYLAMKHECYLFHLDRDFDLIARHFPLKIHAH